MPEITMGEWLDDVLLQAFGKTGNIITGSASKRVGDDERQMVAFLATDKDTDRTRLIVCGSLDEFMKSVEVVEIVHAVTWPTSSPVETYF
ncbi:hypothetical protein [Enterobacter ludwigii]|uniref:hypothetical protein n=1 Tax=Enterobacter ludwigii TaxID=299767 RepID=UPI000642F5F3|nr:hypothetical protein [Enterobacter ludwigii]KLP39848.1 hypothetical protein ABR36_10290 [Enterobacter ludwigii]